MTGNRATRRPDLAVDTGVIFRMATYFFSSPVDVDIKLEGEEVRKQIESKAEKDRPVSCPVYYDGEAVAGQVRRARVFALGLFASFVSAVLRMMVAGHSPRSRWQAHYTRRDQSRVCGKHRHASLCASWILFCSVNG